MIRFSKYFWIYALVSGLVLVPGTYSLLRYGLRPSIDFTGGSLLEVSFPEQPAESLVEGATRTGAHTYIFRRKIGESVAAATQGAILRDETVGPLLGRELLTKSMVAAGIAVAGILAYVAYAFKRITYGFSAVVALLHDLWVVVGVFSLLGAIWGVEVDALFVSAVLTTMSFSVHDTIVVFDRIREYRKKDERSRLDDLADRALTETMGRSLTNSFTIIFMLLALILMGGETIRWFVVALLVGTVSGTYSSPFVATPILLLLDRYGRRKQKAQRGTTPS